MAQRSDSLVDLLVRRAVTFFYAFPLSTFFGVLAVVFAPVYVPRIGLIGQICFFGALAVIALMVARRIRRLHHLGKSGVEVEARLIDVDTSYGETDLRTATYSYDYQGHSYRTSVSGTDLFMAQATRYGEHAIVLLDPSKPSDAIIVRSVDPPVPSVRSAPLELRDDASHEKRPWARSDPRGEL